jgi:type I restriction enzyme S subunit
MREWKDTEAGRIPKEWDVAPLESFLRDRFLSYGVVQPGEEVEGGMPMIRVNNITNGRVNHAEVKGIEPEREEKHRKTRLNGDELLISVVGSLGDTVICDETLQGYNVARAIAVARVERQDDRRWISYSFKLPEVRSSIAAIANTTVQPTLNLTDLRELVLPLPAPEERSSIVTVLSSLDAKIDLLHRQNKTLEAMAETLFRQWFVEEAEEGWEEYGLLDLVQLVPGGTPKTKEASYWDGDIMWISVREISENHKGIVNYAYKYITEDGLQNSAANMLPKFGTVISARGTVGKIGLLARPMAYSQSNFGVLPKDSSNFFFTYLLVHNSIEELHSNSYGAVFDTITTRSFQTIRHRLPNVETVDSFEQLVKPMFLKMLNNTQQIASLTSLRDTLLPKLMSGEVRVEMN